MTQAIAELKGISLFQALDDNDLQALVAGAKRKSLVSGQFVFKEGERADGLYIVMSGRVKIYLNEQGGEQVVLDTKRAGEYFGEMMLDHRPRSASPAWR